MIFALTTAIEHFSEPVEFKLDPHRQIKRHKGFCRDPDKSSMTLDQRKLKKLHSVKQQQKL